MHREARLEDRLRSRARVSGWSPFRKPRWEHGLLANPLSMATVGILALAGLPTAGVAQSSSSRDSAAVGDSVRTDSLALTAAEIDEAIAWGARERKAFAYLYGPIAGGMAGSLFRASGISPSVIAMGPFGRVATEAAIAKRRYLQYDRSSVTPETRLPILIVRAEPPPPSADRSMRSHQPLKIEHIVLQSRTKGSPAVQPLWAREEPFQWQNGFGATFSGTGVSAGFALSDIPSDDFDIVLITSSGEERAFVGKKARPFLR
jgi:hypothetical protein